MFAYLASSWNILGGFCDYFAVGNGAFVGIGGYVTVLLFKVNNISPWIGFIIAGFIAGFISLILSYPCFKLKGSYYTLANLALLFVINIIIHNTERILGYDTGSSMGLKVPWRGGFFNMQFISKVSYYYIILGMLVLVLGLCIYIKNSKIGYYFASLVTNQEAAASLGVPVMRYKLLAQFLSAFFSAMGGGFYGMFIMFLDADRVLGYSLSVEILLFAVVGGKESVWGPVTGTFFLMPISEFLRTKLGSAVAGLPMVIYGIIFMTVVYFIPEGLYIGFKNIITRFFGNKGKIRGAAHG
jgi:branched-chain amino acid transport system permease protein